jgi:hypothetical protein
MERFYLCSNCGTPVAYGYRFCVNCGSKLDWILTQIPPNPSPPMNDCRYPNKQLVYHQQSIQNQQACGNRNVVPQNKNQTMNSATTPMRNEIFKLLDGLFDKPNKYN